MTYEIFNRDSSYIIPLFPIMAQIPGMIFLYLLREVWDMIINSIQTYTNIFLSESLNLRKEWFNDLPIVFYIYNNESLVPNIFSKIRSI